MKVDFPCLQVRSYPVPCGRNVSKVYIFRVTSPLRYADSDKYKETTEPVDVEKSYYVYSIIWMLQQSTSQLGPKSENFKVTQLS